MGEELAEEQLQDFCRRHGLAKDGYLDEIELTTVCKCIGLQVSSEMIKELFEELDGDKDGRVCLSELSQMLRGMQDKIPPSPEKHKVSNDANSLQVGKGNGFSSVPVNERGAFSILDPENSGFAKVGMILDLWSQLGVSESEGSRLLSDLGFTVSTKSHSINLQDLAKSVEDEIDHSKESLPLAFQVALLTYRTEAQFLKSLCESIECERDKLKADILDAHQRSALIAQEVDEQNARMERNGQMLVRKMEIKYSDQLQELQNRFSNEKDSLQQALHIAETKLKELQDEDTKLKVQIIKLNQENCNLEKDLHNLNLEIRNVNRLRSHLEREVSRFRGLENQLQEMERKYTEYLASSDGKLKETYTEMQALRDQNDELSMQLEAVRETLKIVQASQSKEKRFVQKKRKGSSSLNQTHCHSALISSKSSISNQENRRCTEGDMPLNKMGKYYSNEEDRSLEDTEECDSSLEQVASVPKTNNTVEIQCSSGTGTCPKTAIAIELAACIGESSTDPITNGNCGEEEMDSEPSLSTIEEELLLGQSEKECASLESEMCAVVNNERVFVGDVSKEFINKLTKCDCTKFVKKKMKDKGIQSGTSGLHRTSLEDVTTQTVDDNASITVDSLLEEKLLDQLKQRILQLEREISEKKAAYEKVNSDLKTQCSELESSLDLLREEYDKCEDYWHEKLQEARELYDQQKADMDEKFQDLALKITEYEDLVLPPSTNERLPPIEERASLERQVTDLEEECGVLRKELHSVRIEQDSVISNYQRSYENKLKDDCANLEQQVSVLSRKCKGYENRLSALAEEERSTVEEGAMIDLMRERIKQLEFQLRSQDEKSKQQITQLEATLKEREILYKKSIPDVNIVKPLSPQFGQNHWNNNNELKSKSLLEMLQNSQKPESIWPQRFANVADKSSSLPFIPAVDPTFAVQQGAWGSLSPPFQQDTSWAVPPGGPVKKAWCHVELGWLQSLRMRLKARDEQCYLLQRALQQKDSQTEKIVTEMKYQHEMEISNWESLMQASQELLRQHVVKHKEQAEKLAHSDLLMKDLWVENAKLMAALNATEQRVIQLDNLLKFQINHHHHHHHNLSQGPPHGSSNNNNNTNNNNNINTSNAISSAPLSLPHQSSHFNI